MNKLLVVGLVVCMFLVGCGAQELYFCNDGSIGGGQFPTQDKVVYFCPNGMQTTDPNTCEFTPRASISSEDAEEKAETFVEAYVRADGWTTSVINVFEEEANYYAQVVISKRDEDPYDTTVRIDGERGSVTCEQNCGYTQ